MKTEDIILIENNAGGEIHLVKDRLFWQAWERSAFLFVHNFKNYKVHHRFVQKVMQDFVWLGFPEKALGAILATAKSKNFVVKNISDSHIVISNIPNRGGFDAWKENAINSNKVEKGVIPSPDNKSLSQKSDYLLFRLVYDFSVYVLNLVPKFNKIYKFSIGSRIIEDVLDSAEPWHARRAHLLARPRLQRVWSRPQLRRYQPFTFRHAPRFGGLSHKQGECHSACG